MNDSDQLSHIAAPAGNPQPVLLFVDDEANILSALLRLFRPHGYKIHTASRGAEAVALLEQEPIDLVISDMRMPKMDGAQLLEQVRIRWPDTVRILLTGYADIDSAIAAINKGEIYRYVAKPWDDDDMLLVVRQALERKAQEQKMKHLALHDALTGLPNRLLLLSQLEHSIKRAHRHGTQGAVMFLDLDRFKQVNDTMGHAAGDELLKMVVSRLRNRLRDMDMLARLGGDEFVIVLDEIGDPQDASKVGREIVELLAIPFALPDGNVANIGGSIGVALFPQHGAQAAPLVECADRALYKAKEGGRGQCCVHSPAD